MTNLTIEQIKEQLRERVCSVLFKKTDGTERIMNCTLLSSYIEQHNLTPSGGGHIYPDQQIRVVDININQWRSFKYDSIVHFE